MWSWMSHNIGFGFTSDLMKQMVQVLSIVLSVVKQNHHVFH